MIKVFVEENRTIKFITTRDDMSLVYIINYKKNGLGAYKEHYLLTSFTDYDINWLIDEYKEHGLVPLLISESIEQQVNAGLRE